MSLLVADRALADEDPAALLDLVRSAAGEAAAAGRGLPEGVGPGDAEAFRRAFLDRLEAVLGIAQTIVERGRPLSESARQSGVRDGDDGTNTDRNTATGATPPPIVMTFAPFYGGRSCPATSDGIRNGGEHKGAEKSTPSIGMVKEAKRVNRKPNCQRAGLTQYLIFLATRLQETVWQTCQLLMIPVSWGELLDKITILDIKA